MQLPEDVMNETNDLLAELAKELTLPPIANGEVTASMLSEESGMNRSSAERFLKDKLASGELTSRYVRNKQGNKAIAYRKA